MYFVELGSRCTVWWWWLGVDYWNVVRHDGDGLVHDCPSQHLAAETGALQDLGPEEAWPPVVQHLLQLF